MVPKFIDEMIISAEGFKDLNSDVILLNSNEDLPIVEIHGLLCAEIAAPGLSSASDTNAKSITSKLTWRPAIELLTFEEQRTALEKRNGLDKVAEVRPPLLVKSRANNTNSIWNCSITQTQPCLFWHISLGPKTRTQWVFPQY